MEQEANNPCGHLLYKWLWLGALCLVVSLKGERAVDFLLRFIWSHPTRASDSWVFTCPSPSSPSLPYPAWVIDLELLRVPKERRKDQQLNPMCPKMLGEPAIGRTMGKFSFDERETSPPYRQHRTVSSMLTSPLTPSPTDLSATGVSRTRAVTSDGSTLPGKRPKKDTLMRNNEEHECPAMSVYGNAPSNWSMCWGRREGRLRSCIRS